MRDISIPSDMEHTMITIHSCCAALLALGTSVLAQAQTATQPIGRLDDETQATYARIMAQNHREIAAAKRNGKTEIGTSRSRDGGCSIQVGSVPSETRRNVASRQQVTIVNSPTFCVQR